MLRVGAHPVFQNGMNIDGFLDDVRVYEFALNDTQIIELKNDIWGLQCYNVTPPENGLVGACAVPTEFNPGGLLHSDGYLETGTWCNFACLLGYELVGMRPYCNFGFDLGNATCDAVVLTDNWSVHKQSDLPVVIRSLRHLSFACVSWVDSERLLVVAARIHGLRITT
jgi:hypothetical protein